MIIQDKEVVKILKHACDTWLDYKDIEIYSMNVQIEEYIKVQVKAKYYKVDTIIQVIAKVECNDNAIHVKTKGIIKYGFINLDFNKVVQDHVKDIPFITTNSEGLTIDNPYLSAIHYGDGKMEVVVK